MTDQLSIVAISYDPSSLDVEARGSRVQVQSSLGYIKPSLKQMIMKTMALAVINWGLSPCQTTLHSLHSYSFTFFNSLGEVDCDARKFKHFA